MCNTGHDGNEYVLTPEEYNNARLLWYNKIAKAPKTEEWKQKMRRPLSEEHKRKIGEANKGNKRPDLSEFNTRTKKGSKDSYETHLKKCKAQCRENNNNARRVINLDTGEIFGCLGDAARSVNGSTSGLCCYLRTDSRVGISFYKGYR